MWCVSDFIKKLCHIGNFHLFNSSQTFNANPPKLTSICQPTNAHTISHKTLLKHFKTLRHVSILSDHHHHGALFLAKIILHYSQFNSYLQTRCCGSISCCVGMCSGAVARRASYDAHLATASQHNMICCHNQHLVCKYELNCEYCNITLSRNKAPWWWSDTIEICRSVLKCFKSVYMKLYVDSLVDK